MAVWQELLPSYTNVSKRCNVKVHRLKHYVTKFETLFLDIINGYSSRWRGICEVLRNEGNLACEIEKDAGR